MSHLARRFHRIAAPSATALGTRAIRADTWVDHIGVNMRFNAAPIAPLFFDIVVPAMQDLRIRLVRSDMQNAAGASKLSLLALLADQAGAKFMLIAVQGTAGYSDMGVATYTFGLLNPSLVRYWEGADSVDTNYLTWGPTFGSSSGATATNFGPQVLSFEAAKKSFRDGSGDYRVRAIKLISPTVAVAANATYLGDASPYSEFAGAQVALLPNGPGVGLVSALTALNAQNVSVDPWSISSEGYDTGVGVVTPAGLVGKEVSELAQAKYIGRMFAENEMLGVEATALFELMDEGGVATDATQNFGLMKSDGTPKIAYGMLKNLIALLGERTYSIPSTIVGNGDLAADTFTRVLATGLGTAESGTDTNLTYRDGDGINSQWKIVTNHGESNVTFAVRQAFGDNHTVGHEVEIPFTNIRAGYIQDIRAGVRYTDANNVYWAVLNPADGNVSLLKYSAGVSSSLGFVVKSALASSTTATIKIRILKVGNDNQLFAKIYQAGSEPATWDIEWNDVGAATGPLSSGSAAFWLNNNSSGQSIRFDNIKSSSVNPTAGFWPALPSLTLGALDYTLSGTIGYVKQRLLQKADGTFWLMLWNQVSTWNSSTKADIVNSDIALSITFNAGAKSVTVFNPRVSATGVSLGAQALFTLDFSADFQHTSSSNSFSVDFSAAFSHSSGALLVTDSFTSDFSAAFYHSVTTSRFDFTVPDELLLLRIA